MEWGAEQIALAVLGALFFFGVVVSLHRESGGCPFSHCSRAAPPHVASRRDRSLWLRSKLN